MRWIGRQFDHPIGREPVASSVALERFETLGADLSERNNWLSCIFPERMVTAFDIGVFVFFFPGGLWFGYRAARATGLYRSLAGTAADSTPTFVDGQPAAVSGEVTDVDPPDASDRLVDGDDAVAAICWKATFPKSGSNRIDFGDRELKQNTATFASNLRSGSFAIADGGRSIGVDPTWLRETHDATPLSDVTVGGVTRSKTFHTYLWDSPYVHIDEEPTRASLETARGIVSKHDASIDLDDYLLETKTIRADDTLSVRGEVRLDQGKPVLRGTDRTPLTISTTGFEGLVGDLKSRAIRYGLASVVLLAISLQFLVL